MSLVQTPSTERILGYPVAGLSLDECVAQVMEWIRSRDGELRDIVCLNPYAAYLANSDEKFAAALRSADLVVPDGIGIVLASQLAGGSIGVRVTGSDVFRGVCAAMGKTVFNRAFFLGSTEAVLNRLTRSVKSQFPGIEIAGTHSPPFRDEFSKAEVLEMVELINAVKPDALWVGMSAPKQEKWIAAAKPYLEVPFAGAVGAVFDYEAGTVQRPGRVVRALGLEWLGRLIKEPQRLWRRTLIAAPWFVRQSLSERIKGSWEEGPRDA